tara:strand:+ start:221 stop:718 length:498 start_codon:yes stop_codon:yes gene_type:complete
MAKFTVSQLDAKPTDYTVLDTDLLLLTIGTSTPFLSSVKVSTKQYADYMTSTYSANNNFTVQGVIGVSANGGDVASGAAIPLTKHASLFVTAAAETSTLAAGSEGQVKVLALKTDGGDMVTTVTNAGWKSSGTGTITFDTIGDSCTLQYIDSKWFCIGNNGAAFA